MRQFHVQIAPVIAFLFSFATGGLAQTPDFTDFRFLPGDDAVSLAVEVQENSDIAKGNAGYLLVWQDARTVTGLLAALSGGPYFEPRLGNMRDICAVRLDAQGNLLDTTPLIISNASYSQARPRVAWNGENWLITWITERDAYFYDDIVAVRVSPDGVVLDSPPIVVRPNAETVYPAVASDGTNWVVVWPEFTGLVRGIKGARIGSDGTLLDPNAVQLRLDTVNSYADMPDIDFAVDEYLLTWTESVPSGRRAVRGQRLTTSLAKIDTNPFTIDAFSTSDGERPRLATNGTDFLVAWHQQWDYTWQRVFGARVSHAGMVLDPSGILIVDFQAYMSFQPVVSWDGTRWFVAYNSEGSAFFDNDIYLTRISPAGTVLDPSGIPVRTGDAYQNQPAIAPVEGGGAHVLWSEYGGTGNNLNDIMRAAVSGGGVVGPPEDVSTGIPRQTRVRFASHDQVHMAAFLSEVSGESRVMAQRLDDLGNPIDLDPVLVASGPELSIGRTSVAWNQSVYLIVWDSSGDTYGRRLGADGTPLDPLPLLILADNDMPDVAALGDLFLVVGSHPYHGDQRAIQGARVEGDGTVLDPAPFWIGSDYDLDPRAAALGDQWLVVWEQQPTHDQEASSIQGEFVSQTGSVSTAFAIQGPGYGDDPDLAVNGDVALVVYSDNNAKIDGRLVDSTGSLLGPEFLIADAANDRFFPAVDWDGGEYFVAWVDFRNVAYLDQLRGDIYAARVDASGNVIDPDGFQVSSGPLPEDFPEVGGLGGRTVLAYSALGESVPETYRIGTHFFTEEQMLALEGPAPGIPGTVNTLDVSGATPGARVFFVFGFQPGSTQIPGCQGMQVGITNPRIAGSRIANQDGIASFSTYVPTGASGLTVFFQAVEWPGCVISEVVIHTFP